MFNTRCRRDAAGWVIDVGLTIGSVVRDRGLGEQMAGS